MRGNHFPPPSFAARHPDIPWRYNTTIAASAPDISKSLIHTVFPVSERDLETSLLACSTNVTYIRSPTASQRCFQKQWIDARGNRGKCARAAQARIAENVCREIKKARLLYVHIWQNAMASREWKCDCNARIFARATGDTIYIPRASVFFLVYTAHARVCDFNAKAMPAPSWMHRGGNW